jgi:hypothetical protein
MNTKKVGLIVLIACAIMVISATNSLAAYNWFSCTIDYSGAGTKFIVRLDGTENGGSHRTFTNKVFQLHPDITNQMLAVLLTAQSLNASILVYCDPDQTGQPIIAAIQLATP